MFVELAGTPLECPRPRVCERPGVVAQSQPWHEYIVNCPFSLRINRSSQHRPLKFNSPKEVVLLDSRMICKKISYSSLYITDLACQRVNRPIKGKNTYFYLYLPNGKEAYFLCAY